MKKEEMELILSVVAQRSVGLSDNQFKSVEMQDPVDLLDALGFTEVKLVIPTKEAIVVVDCGEKQIVIRGDDEVLRFIDKKMDCPGIVNATLSWKNAGTLALEDSISYLGKGLGLTQFLLTFAKFPLESLLSS